MVFAMRPAGAVLLLAALLNLAAFTVNATVTLAPSKAAGGYYNYYSDVNPASYGYYGYASKAERRLLAETSNLAARLPAIGNGFKNAIFGGASILPATAPQRTLLSAGGYTPSYYAPSYSYSGYYGYSSKVERRRLSEEPAQLLAPAFLSATAPAGRALLSESYGPSYYKPSYSYSGYYGYSSKVERRRILAEPSIFSGIKNVLSWRPRALLAVDEPTGYAPSYYKPSYAYSGYYGYSSKVERRRQLLESSNSAAQPALPLFANSASQLPTLSTATFADQHRSLITVAEPKLSASPYYGAYYAPVYSSGGYYGYSAKQEK